MTATSSPVTRPSRTSAAANTLAPEPIGDLAGGQREQRQREELGQPVRPDESRIGVITTRRIVYGLAAMVALLVAGTIIGLIWADTSDVAGAIAVGTNIIGVVGIAVLLIALGVARRRRQS